MEQERFHGTKPPYPKIKSVVSLRLVLEKERPCKDLRKSENMTLDLITV